MARYYWNSEFDTIESIDDIRTDYYDLFGHDYDTFGDYLTACQWYNNGVLHTVEERLAEVKRRLNDALELARAYGWEEFTEEVTELMAEMHRLSKYARERA